MRSPAGRIILKIVELIGCITCVVTKALTDQESRRVFLRNQKLSREWGLLHNIFWSTSGNAFANVTYGGFTLIIALMLISRFIDAKSRPSLVEKIFLTVGMLCFFAMGGIVFAALDQVPSDLHDNAIILGSLSFLIAILFLIDLADPMARHITDTTQTDFIPNIMSQSAHTRPIESPNLDKKETSTNNNNNNNNATITSPVSVVQMHNEPTIEHANNNNSYAQQNGNYVPNNLDKQNVQSERIQEHESHQNTTNHDDFARSGQFHRSENVDIVHARILPVQQQPIFEKVLLPEKKRPYWKNVPDPRDNSSKLQFVNGDFMPPASHHVYEYEPTNQQSHHYNNNGYVRELQHSPQQFRQSFHTNHSREMPPSQHQLRQSFHTNHSREMPPAQQFRQSFHSNHSTGGSVAGRYDRPPRLMVVRDYSYSRASTASAAVPMAAAYQEEDFNKSLDSTRNSNRSAKSSVRRRGECNSVADVDEFPELAVEPGFVANAAKIWDNRVRAKQSYDFNTDV